MLYYGAGVGRSHSLMLKPKIFYRVPQVGPRASKW